jgi:nitrile hydratase accessory protein
MTDEALESVIEAGKTATEPPADGDDVNFEAPWQARAFGITVALRRREAFDWSRFRDRLVAELEDADAGDEATYYEAWLRAIEGLLVDDGVVEAGELAERARAFDRGERDASEFVVGGHGHDHSHGHDHENGHDQEH